MPSPEESSPKLPPEFQRAVEFHGHLCPGLLIGCRASELAMELLGSKRSEDEELVAFAQNLSCSIDAVQAMTGCTMGKGNLFLRDWGKQVFLFALRPGGEAVRLAFRSELKKPGPPTPERRAESVRLLLSTPAKDLFRVKRLTITLPPEAEIRPSVACDKCGEATMDTRLKVVSGKKLCPECAGEGFSSQL